MSMPNPSGRDRPDDTAIGLTVADAALLISQHAKGNAKRMHGICDRIRQHVDRTGQKVLSANLIDRIADELLAEGGHYDAAAGDEAGNNTGRAASLGDQTGLAKRFRWTFRKDPGQANFTVEIVSIGAAALLITVLAFRPDLMERGITAISGAEPNRPILAALPTTPVAEALAGPIVEAAVARPANDHGPGSGNDSVIEVEKFAALAADPGSPPAAADLAPELADITKQRDALLAERLALLKDRDSLLDRVAKASIANPTAALASTGEKPTMVNLRAERDRLSQQVESLLVANKLLEDGLSRASVSNLESQREIAGHLTDMAGLRVENSKLTRLVERTEKLSTDRLAKRRGQVERLLKRSRQQLSAGKYIEPIGDNAVETLHQILLLHPRHAEALRGTETIKSEFRRLAGLSKAARDWVNALAYYRTVQRIDPSDKKIASEILAIAERQRSDPRRADLDARQ